ncbi:MAG: hypothetical protein A3J07_01740 [Candidatus Doudnabacteria bacterium RIFCSPLOWO2_02_FULL_49_13]|uniref:SCP domain-containing protein n=1 Tax=Candidatus Doudnabacteria bacterium RIFCSPHIGHO2_12_FULL_48_16 TaxID=1817838 RepID=A0A1F5PL50_9BACT|nr:MAG: hypothetical protein A3B77_00975 [Candidatus Doudnabacteria bacterium RIFCSPHIGHO2_02_FULL_49_24]OGE88815.1 MAG: hypothetical protein A2760_01330 [Candidatus Doudnabacteria bacterium RIFCSPHIGHO2_01_FULL_50_67]OGE90663.1 MAG: hypothetical protein A3E29_00835 [Candidatus Doudnabacteria bacterium RIFCSPHIGHO2_12_FULL_48_16]OGE96996.1 MAG: hypothetical protein A2990_02865 [Candidatus Doudnabacteria bacterium RIFCSPLOWO2_01_FULL_49_40]OGF02529.1 MAG: hypothetical protein A3J07_01740 [Candid
MAFKLRLGLLILGLFALSGSSLSPQTLAIGDILNTLNHDRQSRGLAALEINPTLNLAALAKAQDMAANKYFAHTSPQGIEPWHWFKALGYDYAYAGENLALGFTDPLELESSLMASSSHRANILSPFYSEVGLATVNSNGTTVVVQLFGSREERVSLRQ